MTFKRLTLLACTLCMVLGFATSAMAKQTPIERVKEGTDKLIQMLSSPDMQVPEKHDEAIAELRKAAEQYIDFKVVTMYAVGKPWKKMSDTMRSDLTEAFIQLLERSYLQNIPAYGGQKVNYKKEQVSGKKAKVVTEIIDKDKKIVVEFRLRDMGSQWMIYDVVAEGVSLVANYRSQFSQVLTDGGAEKLLEMIRERVKKLDAGQAEDKPANS